MTNLDFSINAKGGDRLSRVVSDSAPLTKAGRIRVKELDWSDSELDLLRQHYAKMPYPELTRLLGRSKSAICVKAHRMKIWRDHPMSQKTMERLKFIDPIIVILREERRRRRLTVRQAAKLSGYNRNTIMAWELGVCEPHISQLRNWAQALGRDVTLADNPIQFPSHEVMKRKWMGRR